MTVHHNLTTQAISVSIKPDRRHIDVYHAERGESTDPHTFRPGRWTDHLETLALKADERAKTNERARAARRASLYNELYAPVDDAELFADLFKSPDREETE